MMKIFKPFRCALAVLAGIALTACSSIGGDNLQTAPASAADAASAAPDYLIGPLDKLEIFVWRAEELSTNVTVRPDGRISTPLVEDMVAAGKTPSALASDIEGALREYVKSPEVTVIVSDFSSTFDQQVRVLGEAQTPTALPYQAGMTTLDVMVAVGGLTEFAAGNRAVLIRGQGDDRQSYRLKLDDLLRKGNISANVPVLPGDVILIPESVF
ncbi:polysaccharide export protein [Hyphococcus flavus]|uniref:Polysaccharide export protein n=1 Tax=Hyphococcus flavus TaxID=1866326 RepID=A0AAF0CBW5_9PROT|nr:XrtA/PEP-CTERM system exopolysaccharide export protein [Hyphococcus flavus]WDI32005.1 polysaccharide export protein [Hyphococcus flavus]